MDWLTVSLTLELRAVLSSSPLGLQEGAGKIAAAEGIVRVILNENCNRYEYMMQFLNQVMIGLHDTVSIKETLDAEIRDKDGNVVRRERIECRAESREEKRRKKVAGTDITKWRIGNIDSCRLAPIRFVPFFPSRPRPIALNVYLCYF